MFAGVDNASWTGFPLFLLAMAFLLVVWLVVSPFTIQHARLVQRSGAVVVGCLMGLAESWHAHSQLGSVDVHLNRMTVAAMEMRAL